MTPARDPKHSFFLDQDVWLLGYLVFGYGVVGSCIYHLTICVYTICIPFDHLTMLLQSGGACSPLNPSPLPSSVRGNNIGNKVETIVGILLFDGIWGSLGELWWSLGGL